MSEERYSRYFTKVWEAAQDICVRHPKFHDLLVIVANGGKRKEVQQIHFHMFTGHEVVNTYAAQAQEESALYSNKDICVLEHPHPNWEVHFVIKLR